MKEKKRKEKKKESLIKRKEKPELNQDYYEYFSDLYILNNILKKMKILDEYLLRKGKKRKTIAIKM